MSGIVGLWNLDGRPVDPGLLKRMSETIAHRGPDGEGHWIDGPVGLACQLMRVTPESLSESQPLADPSGVVLVWDGRLDNRDELLGIIDRTPGVAADAPDPVLVIEAYKALGDKQPEHLNGDFAFAIFDAKKQQLLLVRDSIGVRPLYYCRAGNTFLFASEIKAILAHPQVSTRPNDDMLAAFLIGSRAEECHGMTFFEGVSSLRPSHVAVVTCDSFATRQYWDFDPKQKIRFRSFPEYAEAFRHHFEEAVRRRTRSAYPVAVSVSGGLDSSSIFCVAETLRQRDPDRFSPVLGLSYTSDDGAPSDEKAFLVEIERHYHTVAIERVPMGLPGFMDGSAEEVWHVEAPFLDLHWNSTTRFLRSVQQRGPRILLTGHWGDQMLFDQAYLTDLFQHFAWGDISAHLREFRRWMPDVDSTVFRKLFFRDLKRYVIRSHLPDALISGIQLLKRKFSRSSENSRWYAEVFRTMAARDGSPKPFADGSRATAHFKSLYQEARSRYHVLCMEWNNKIASMYGMEMAFPFLDRDLVSFLMSIPGEAQTSEGTPKALLREAMRGVLPTGIVERRGKADFSDFANSGVERDYPQFIDLLQSGGLAVRSGYVGRDALRRETARLKSRIMGPDCLVSWRFRELIGLELWLGTFFDSTKTENEVKGICQRELSPMMLGRAL